MLIRWRPSQLCNVVSSLMYTYTFMYVYTYTYTYICIKTKDVTKPDIWTRLRWVIIPNLSLPDVHQKFVSHHHFFSCSEKMREKVASIFYKLGTEKCKLTHPLSFFPPEEVDQLQQKVSETKEVLNLSEHWCSISYNSYLSGFFDFLPLFLHTMKYSAQ